MSTAQQIKYNKNHVNHMQSDITIEKNIYMPSNSGGPLKAQISSLIILLAKIADKITDLCLPNVTTPL